MNTQDETRLLELMRAYHDAMVEARTDLLDQLVAPDYSLVHITGYRQPRQEWFGVIQSGEFDYHRIEVDPKALSIRVAGETAVVTGRGIFHATISGINNPWRLQFELQCGRSNGRWTILQARYRSF